MSDSLTRFVDVLLQLSLIDEETHRESHAYITSSFPLAAAGSTADGAASPADETVVRAFSDSSLEDSSQDFSLEVSDTCQGLIDRLGDSLTEYQQDQIKNGSPDRLVVDDYLVLEELDRGGMGAVYKAKHVLMGQDVAIKFTLSGSADLEERFLREVEAASKLSHGNIVQALNAGISGDACYLVMEYVDGQNLDRHVREQGPLAFAETLDLLIQAAKGLAYAHTNNIVHRDIKPSNLLLDKAGRIKILDMGLARIRPPEMDEELSTLARVDGSLTGRGELLGTVDYMAPEQAENPHEVDQRADIYSLGCTFYQLLTTAPPFRHVSERVLDRLLAHRQQPIPSLCQRRPDLPREADAVFAKMLAKKPADRYDNTEQLIEDLQGLRPFADLNDRTGGDIVLKPEKPATKNASHRRSFLLALGVLLGLGIGLGVPFFLQPRYGRVKPIGEGKKFQQPGRPINARDVSDPVLTNTPPKPQPKKEQDVFLHPIAGPVDLIPLINLSRDVLSAKGWEITPENVLKIPQHIPSKVLVRADIPEEFDVNVAVIRRVGTGPFVLLLNHQLRKLVVRIDTLKGASGTVTSLGLRVSPTPGVKKKMEMVANVDSVLSLPKDKPVRFRLEVRTDVISLHHVSGASSTEVLRWKGDPRSLRFGAGWGLGEKEVGLAIAANNAAFDVTAIQLVPASVTVEPDRK